MRIKAHSVGVMCLDSRWGRCSLPFLPRKELVSLVDQARGRAENLLRRGTLGRTRVDAEVRIGRHLCARNT